MITALRGKFLLVFDASNANVNVYSVNANTGAVTPISGSPFAIGGNGAGNLNLDPSGQFLYVPRLSGVAVLSLDGTTGMLTPVVGSSFSDGSVVRAGIVDPLGKFYYATGNTTQSTLSAFAVNSTDGTLTAITGSPFVTLLGQPYNIVVHPSGNFLYATMPSANSVIVWTIDRVSGVPTVASGSPFPAGTGPLRLVLDPAGKFLYTCSTNDNLIFGFKIDSNSGALTAISGSPFAGNGVVLDLAIDPSGKFLYAANVNPDAITGYNIDALTGALTQLSGSPFQASGPTLLVIAANQ
jgi:6-phosphogluconolactonase (cycloisomerase 2 family)